MKGKPRKNPPDNWQERDREIADKLNKLLHSAYVEWKAKIDNEEKEHSHGKKS